MGWVWSSDSGADRLEPKERTGVGRPTVAGFSPLFATCSFLGARGQVDAIHVPLGVWQGGALR